MVNRLSLSFFLLPLLLLTGCGEDPCPYGSLLDSEAGLALTEEEHPTGWGQGDCWSCHVQATLHRSGCSPDVDLAAIRAEVERHPRSCADCHGSNGVAE